MRWPAVTRHLLTLLSSVTLLSTGCTSSPPISTPDQTWTWVDFPDTTCDEGTPTGLGVNATDSKNLFIYFEGGGACWDYATCVQQPIYARGPFTQTQFNQRVSLLGNRTLFDRTLAANPYKDWNMFYIPYCTGDLHIGHADAVYTNGTTSKTVHHQGRTNTEAFLARIVATVPEPEQVLVTGASAGGYGAALNYALVRDAFPKARVFLLDDSGPLLKNDAISPALRTAWSKAWNYQPVFDAIDPSVKDDFSSLYTALARRYPEDRMALLSSQQDQTIRAYLGLSAPGFQTALEDLNATVLTPLPHTRYFVTTGQAHTMVGNPGSQSSQGVTLLDWLNQMHNGSDADWKSVRP